MLRKLVLILCSGLLLAGCTLPGFIKKNAGIRVSVGEGQQATVTLDGLDLGQTPVDSKELKPGTYTLKLTPQEAGLQPYETSVTLTSGLVTVVNWSFGATPEESGGEIFEMTKISSRSRAELSVVTNPDNIVVKVDGQSKGFSPLIIDDLAEGQHTLTLGAPGYVERTSNPTLVKGYRITVTTKLGREPETPLLESETDPSPSPSPGASPRPSATPTASASGTISTTGTPDFPYVEITETGTGWLRVRAEASATAEEVAKLDVGSRVPYLDETVSGWHKVEYTDGEEGWVSGQYAVVHKE